jgi:integrase
VTAQASSDPRSRGKLRGTTASPRQADYMWTVMSMVFRLAVRDGILDVNPCAGGKMLYAGTRVNTIWSSPQVGSFLAATKFAYMHMPLLIGLWTGQREGDVLRLTWAQYDGATLTLSQHKGRRRGGQGWASIVVIPVAEPLKVALDAELAARKAAKVSPLRIEEQTICRWREFRRSARHRGDKAGARRPHGAGDLRHHDTATRTQPHPAGHYLHRDPEIAWNAIRKLEA